MTATSMYSPQALATQVVTARPPLSIGPLLAAALDHVDYGLALVDPEARALHLNHRARQTLAGGGALLLQGGRIVGVEAADDVVLLRALRDGAERGLRRLIRLGRDGTRCSAAVVPVEPGVAALMLGRLHLCEDLSMQGFAQAHALSAAEGRVLSALSRGHAPTRIAQEHGVALSTVRTQIGAILDKTGAGSIRELLRMMAALPPIVGALRH